MLIAFGASLLVFKLLVLYDSSQLKPTSDFSVTHTADAKRRAEAVISVRVRRVVTIPVTIRVNVGNIRRIITERAHFQCDYDGLLNRNSISVANG